MPDLCGEANLLTKTKPTHRCQQCKTARSADGAGLNGLPPARALTVEPAVPNEPEHPSLNNSDCPEHLKRDIAAKKDPGGALGGPPGS